ncbi:MAG: hypothetical protein HKO82_00760 [Acidimicrobiia bacterium]|nr:hypothetical protein [Acidimicrobiia bacterium]NNL12201.1 hypothetical protein [Acidimicrobiia bacterium]
MAGGFRKRYVQTPDGGRWIVERHWLARRPRYFGYRFRRPRRERVFEPPLSPRPEIHRPRPNAVQPPVPNPYRDNKELARRDGGSWIFWGGGGSGRSSGRSGGGWFGGLGGSGSSGSSGGGSRGGSSGGGSRGGSSGGGSRDGGGGGGAAGAAGGLLAVLAKVLLYVAIAAAVVLAALITIFVLIPGLVFVAQYLLFWVLVGGWMLYNTLTGRPWVVIATRHGYENPDHAWRIKGWRNSQALIDDLADDLRRGEPPIPSEVAVEVELIED